MLVHILLLLAHTGHKVFSAAVSFCPSAPERKEHYRGCVERPTTGDEWLRSFHGRHKPSRPHTRPHHQLFRLFSTAHHKCHAHASTLHYLSPSSAFSTRPLPSPSHSFTYIIVSPLSLQQPSTFWQSCGFVYSPRASSDLLSVTRCPASPLATQRPCFAPEGKL